MRLIIGNIYQGRHNFARQKYGNNISIMDDLEDFVRDNMAEETIEKVVQKALEYAGQADVVIASEGYGGLTQIEEEERLYAKAYGETLTALAREAESVERVVCGLGMSMK